MKDIKIVSYEDIKDNIRLTSEAWSRVYAVEDRDAALRAELYWPEGFLDSLRGKSLEQQMACYRIVEEEHRSRTAYGKVTKENSHAFGYALEDYKDLNALIVDDGILIGVCIDAFAINYFSNPYGAPAFPYQDICTYYASDNNGSGSNDREDYAHLCCVMTEE
ncbi:MAG: hypothetical protein J6L88_08645 [Clostridia bacterium]|nr:hypothetical protein [Clostridia bacterium]